MDNKNQFSRLAKRASIIITASLAALTGTAASAVPIHTTSNSEGNTIEYAQAKKVKPMQVLKLNKNNPLLSKLVAQHDSHSSHNSHSSHSSHRSGGMFA